MKIIVSKKTLCAALGHCASAATKNSTMPILRCVLLAPSSDGFTVRAANEGIKMAVACKVAAKVTAPESLCIPAHDFLERAKALPDGDIEIYTKAGKLSLKSGKRQLSLSTLPAEDYPALPDPVGEQSAVPVATLAECIRSVLFAVSDDPANGAMHGMKLDLTGELIWSAGTDARRISEFRARVPGLFGAAINALIPKASANLLRSVLDGATGDAAVSSSGPTLYVTLGDITFAAVTLADNKFPPIENVFVASRNPCEVMTAAAGDSLKALAVVSGRTGAVKIAASGDVLRASVQSEENGESSDEFMATGGAFDAVKVQAQYLIDALLATGSETATIDCGAHNEVIMVCGGNVRGAIMPVVI